MTADEVKALQERVREKSKAKPSAILGTLVQPRVKAKGKTRPRERGMRKVEKEYARYLEGEKVAGRILFYDYECIKIRLADTCYWIPDFMVMDADGMIELHDTKALWSTGKPGIEPDALIKMKGIGEKYPMFRILATWKEDGIWKVREF